MKSSREFLFWFRISIVFSFISGSLLNHEISKRAFRWVQVYLHKVSWRMFWHPRTGECGKGLDGISGSLGIRRSRIVIQAGVKPRRPAAIHGELRNCIETVCCNDIFQTENATYLQHCSGCQVSKMPGSLRSNIEAPGRRMEQLHGHHWKCQRYRIYMNLLVVGKIECHMSSPPGLQYRVVFFVFRQLKVSSFHPCIPHHRWCAYLFVKMLGAHLSIEIWNTIYDYASPFKFSLQNGRTWVVYKRVFIY